MLSVGAILDQNGFGRGGLWLISGCEQRVGLPLDLKANGKLELLVRQTPRQMPVGRINDHAAGSGDEFLVAKPFPILASFPVISP